MWSSELRVVLLRVVLMGAIFACTGCVEVAVHETREPFDYSPVDAPPPPKPRDGSIWTGEKSGGSFLFYDRKARGIGDLVTVLVVENFSAEGSATTSVGKSSSMGASLSSDLGFAQLLSQSTRWFLELLGVANPGQDVVGGAELNAIDASNSNTFSGDGETTREGSLNAVVTCRVLSEHLGGLFHIRGSRRIIVNHEMQLLTVEGLVRREDISIQNTVPSTALADAQLTFDGVGVIDDKQRPPLFARLMDWLYPF